MRQGEVVETGPTAPLFARPEHPYTRMLLAAEPEGTQVRRRRPARPSCIDRRGRARHLRHRRRPLHGGARGPGGRRGQPPPARAADDRHRRRVRAPASRRSAARCCASCRARAASPTSAARSTPTRALMRPLRSELQLVFQDPFGSLSPRMTIGRIITEGLLVHRPELSAQGARPPRRRGAGRGRPQARHAQPLPARILRRPAPAHRHRPRDDPEAAASSSSTSRRAPSTARCRSRWSSSCATCRRSTASPTSSSATTSPWCAPSPTTSS